MHTIKLNRLKQIIKEELEAMQASDPVDSVQEYEAAAKNSQVCAKLLIAIANFKRDASEKTKSAAQEEGLDGLEKKLKFIVGPTDYIDPVSADQPVSTDSTQKLDSTPKKIAVKSQVKKPM